jgi:hypothetical protein
VLGKDSSANDPVSAYAVHEDVASDSLHPRLLANANYPLPSLSGTIVAVLLRGVLDHNGRSKFSLKRIHIQTYAAVYILCLWHVHKAVTAYAMLHCFQNCQDDTELDECVDLWKQLCQSDTEELYDTRLVEFCEAYPALDDYVKTTWLNHHAKSIVDCFVNKHTHLGLRYSSPVEKQNHLIKWHNEFAPGNYLKFLDAFGRMADLQYQRISRQLAQQSQRTPTVVYGLRLFANVQNKICERAVHLLNQQLEKYLQSKAVDGDALPACSHFMQRCLGLPCAHQIEEYVDNLKPISMADVHPSWYINPTGDNTDKLLRLEQELVDPIGMLPYCMTTSISSLLGSLLHYALFCCTLVIVLLHSAPPLCDTLLCFDIQCSTLFSILLRSNSNTTSTIRYEQAAERKQGQEDRR